MTTRHEQEKATTVSINDQEQHKMWIHDHQRLSARHLMDVYAAAAITAKTNECIFLENNILHFLRDNVYKLVLFADYK